MTPCPSCGTPVAGAPGTEVVCPACFSAFTVAQPAVTSFDVLLVDGTRHDGVNRWLLRERSWLLRERVYTNRYPPTARISPAGRNDWAPAHEVAELRALYTLVGTEMPLATGTRRIAGWRSAHEAAPRPARSAAVESERGVARANAPAPSPPPAPPARPFTPPKPNRPPAPVVAEGATVRLVAGGDEDLDLEDDEVEAEAPPVAAPTPPAPRELTIAAPKRSLLPWILVGLAAAALGLAAVLLGGAFLFG